MIKKTLCLLLALLMLLPLVVSCKKDEEDVSDETAGAADVATEESATDSSKYDERDDVGDMDLGGRAITIAQPAMSMYLSEIDVERMTGDIVNDAIYKRNATVEKRLNCDIKALPVGGAEANQHTVLTDLESNVLNQSVGYDAILNTSFTTCSYVTRGIFKDLGSVEKINLNKTYWATFVNDAIEIGGIQYAASGAISLSFYKYVWITVVNNSILAKTTGEVPNLLKIADDGQWTIKYQKTLAEQYYSNDGSQYGFVSGTASETDPYVCSAGLTVLQKNADGFLTWAFDLEKATKVMDDIVALYTSPASSIGSGTLNMFVDRKTLMSTVMFETLENESIRNMTDTYTVLPIPKYTEDQPTYQSSLNDYFSVLAIPVTVSESDIEAVGAAMEVLASESWGTVAPAYYEVALKVKYVENPDAWNLMDHIIENVKMDAVMAYIDLITFSGEERNTVMKLWRWSTARAVQSGSSVMGSLFNSNVPSKVQNSLDGINGLQTYIRQQLANG